MTNSSSTIIFGIGNSGRSDDGLGWAFLDKIEQTGEFEGELIYRYQLQIEDAELIRNAKQVIFVDAHQGKLDNGFEWRDCVPSNTYSFTSHELAPEAILFLCQDLYEVLPPTKVLVLEGQNWDLNIGMSTSAINNLDAAFEDFHNKVMKHSVV